MKVRALSYEFLPIQTTTYEIFNRREEFREQIVSFSKYSLNHYVVTWLLLMREKSTSFWARIFPFYNVLILNLKRFRNPSNKIETGKLHRVLHKGARMRVLFPGYLILSHSRWNLVKS